jgi:hypothetical protein
MPLLLLVQPHKVNKHFCWAIRDRAGAFYGTIKITRPAISLRRIIAQLFLHENLMTPCSNLNTTPVQP